MKNIADLGSEIYNAVTEGNLLLEDNSREDNLSIFYTYIENYTSKDIDKTVYGGDIYRIIIEPPAQWPVSLRAARGLSENVCNTTFEVNVYVFKRGISDDDFVKLTATEGVYDMGYNFLNYYDQANLSVIDDCLDLLQWFTACIHLHFDSKNGSMQINTVDGLLDVQPIGITTKNEYGIMKKLSMTWYE